MSTYVIGDVQGCFEPFMRLMDHVAFDSGRDSVWFAGDLVNRGPASLEVLRWARKNGARAVLGNHEIYLLARAAGLGGDTSGSSGRVDTEASERPPLSDAAVNSEALNAAAIR